MRLPGIFDCFNELKFRVPHRRFVHHPQHGVYNPTLSHDYNGSPRLRCSFKSLSRFGNSYFGMFIFCSFLSCNVKSYAKIHFSTIAHQLTKIHTTLQDCEERMSASSRSANISLFIISASVIIFRCRTAKKIAAFQAVLPHFCKLRGTAHRARRNTRGLTSAR